MRVTKASQYEPSAVPEGRSNSTRHDVMAPGPPLATVNLASKPVPQSWVLAKVAVTPGAADAAGPTTREPMVSALAASRVVSRIGMRDMKGSSSAGSAG